MSAHPIPLHQKAELLVEQVMLSPSTANKWLKENDGNRHLRPSHVRFLRDQILNGEWQLNGQPIVIADDGTLLDGQHRLHAVVEADTAVPTLVVYGVDKMAYLSMDTGIRRTPADVVEKEYPEATKDLCMAAATGVHWSCVIEARFHGYAGSIGGKNRATNAHVVTYLAANPHIWSCAERLLEFPKNARPVSIGQGTGLYYQFMKRDRDTADEFMRRFFTGEDLKMNDPEYILRAALQKDAQRQAHWSPPARVKMVVKTWNRIRSGKTTAKYNVAMRGDEKGPLEVL